MSVFDLTNLTLAEASALIESRDVSPLELTDACIARSEALDPELHAYITKTFDSAQEEARRATDEIAHGVYRGPLHGIPFALKDLYETAGVRTTAGSKVREAFVPTEDAQVVTLLRQAGVVFLGKLNMHEWAYGTTNINSYFPSPRNPWDPRRITGGSSGGSAVAVATGMCLGTLGSDTGGSIRIPVALCGISGLKPTYGRSSLRGVVPLAWSLDHAGPMARTALDCAVILQAIAGYDTADPNSVDWPVEDYARDIGAPIEGLRIGVPSNYFFDESSVDREITSAVVTAMKALSDLDADIRQVEVPGIEEAVRANGVILGADAAAYHEMTMRDHAEEVDPTVLARLQSGTNLSGIDYARARRVQSEFQAALLGLFEDIDVLLAPTTALIAPEFPTGAAPPPGMLSRHTGAFNLSGSPAMSVLCGFSSQGLPIGMMLVSRPWEEALVLRVAHAYQQVTDWHRRRPSL